MQPDRPFPLGLGPEDVVDRLYENKAVRRGKNLRPSPSSRRMASPMLCRSPAGCNEMKLNPDSIQRGRIPSPLPIGLVREDHVPDQCVR